MTVRIITTFIKEVEVDANSKEEAEQIVLDEISEGEIDSIDTDNFDTEVEAL